MFLFLGAACVKQAQQMRNIGPTKDGLPISACHAEGPSPATASWSDLPDAPTNDPVATLPHPPDSKASDLPSAPRFSHTGVLYNVPGLGSEHDTSHTAVASDPPAEDVEEDLMARMKRLQQK